VDAAHVHRRLAQRDDSASDSFSGFVALGTRRLVALVPMYDRRCAFCGWTAIDRLEAIAAWILPCPECGQPTERAWLTKPPAAIGDEMDHVQVNGLNQPRRFRHKSERKRALKEAGWREYDAHCPTPGSDHDPHSVKWGAGGKVWLDKVEAQAREHHNGGFIGNAPADPNSEFHITWSTGTLTPEQVAHYRKQT
jgi:hypothetical protein